MSGMSNGRGLPIFAWRLTATVGLGSSTQGSSMTSAWEKGFVKPAGLASRTRNSTQRPFTWQRYVLPGSSSTCASASIKEIVIGTFVKGHELTKAIIRHGLQSRKSCESPDEVARQ